MVLYSPTVAMNWDAVPESRRTCTPVVTPATGGLPGAVTSTITSGISTRSPTLGVVAHPTVLKVTSMVKSVWVTPKTLETVTDWTPRTSGSVSSCRKPLNRSPVTEDLPPERKARTTSSVGDSGSEGPLPLKATPWAVRFSRMSNCAADGLTRSGCAGPRWAG